MMKLKRFLLPIFIVGIVLISCREKEEEITVSIVGKWAGDKVDFRINPDGIVPAFTIPEDNFPVTLEFKNDGTLILTDEKNKSYNGTYALNGHQLTINIDYTFEYIEFSGVYEVEKLTNSVLQASIEKAGSFEHPDYGHLNGKIKATMFFTRSNN